MSKALDNMDRVISPEKIRKRRIRNFVLTFLVVAMFAASWYILKSFVEPVLKRSNIKTAKVEQGDIFSSISASGVVEAEYEHLLLAPFSGKIKEIIKTSGSSVKKGDIILVLDQKEVNEQLENLEDQLRLNFNSYHQNQLNSSNLQLERDHQLDVKKFKISDLETQINEETQLLEVGGIAEEKVRNTKQQLNLAKKELELVKSQNIIRVEKIKAEQEALNLTIKMKKREVAKTKELLDAAYVTAPDSGVVIAVKGREGQTLQQGAEMVRISDLSTYKLTGKIADSNAEKLHSGGKVIAINDNTKLTGTIGNVRPEVENGMIKFDVFLLQNNHPDLRPNLNMELQVITAEKTNTLRLPDGPFYDGSKELKVLCIENDMAVSKTVKIGLANFEFVEILSELNEGDEVIISDISKVNHLEKVKIKE
jgi:HlyD family secretion protein